MSAAATVGVVVMAYGTPRSPADVEAFYTDVRRGRPPSDEQLADLRRRYDAIGGVSPLAERTAEQVAAVQAALDDLDPGRYRCLLGTKHSVPRIEAAVDDLAAAGVGAVVGLVLAPHYSRGSVGEYAARLGQRAAEHGLAASCVLDWHDDEALIELLAERVVAARATLGPAGSGTGPPGSSDPAPLLLVTAHSLPLRVVADGDPYADELQSTADLVAARAGMEPHEIGWQSAGRTPEPWLGPDVLDHLRSLPARGFAAVVVCPAGFTSDHLEVLYDLDVDAQRVADEVGLSFQRTASLNAEPRLAASLARRVAEVAAGLRAGAGGPDGGGPGGAAGRGAPGAAGRGQA